MISTSYENVPRRQKAKAFELADKIAADPKRTVDVYIEQSSIVIDVFTRDEKYMYTINVDRDGLATVQPIRGKLPTISEE